MASARELVLAHEDLAAQLTRPPLSYRSPQQWNGYIPPYMVPGSGRHVRNDSPQRVHLVAIVREAIARKDGEDRARAWLASINTDHWSGPWNPHQAATN